MTTMASQITSLTVVYSTVYSDADQGKPQSFASLAFVWGIHRDRWIPRTYGQLRGKCFHLMTSSWMPGNLQEHQQRQWNNVDETACAEFSGHGDRSLMNIVPKQETLSDFLWHTTTTNLTSNQKRQVRASNADNISIWWRHHDNFICDIIAAVEVRVWVVNHIPLFCDDMIMLKVEVSLVSLC